MTNKKTEQATAKELAELRAALEAERVARKQARRGCAGYNPAMILMSPFEDEGLVLAQYRHEHPGEIGDYELVAYAIDEPRSELCTAASRAAGEAWEAQAVAQAAQEAAEKFQREVVSEETASVSEPDLQGMEEATEPPVEDAPEPPAPQRSNGFSWSSEPWSWMTR